MSSEIFNTRAKEEENPYEALTEFSRRIYSDNLAKGFYDDEMAIRLHLSKDPTKHQSYIKSVRAQRIALVTSELSEALEADRKDLMDDHLPQYYGFDVELADALIRILDMCGANNVDIGKVVRDKLAYNKSRPFKHGKAF